MYRIVKVYFLIWFQKTDIAHPYTRNKTHVSKLSSTGSPYQKLKVKGCVWGFFGTAACRPIVPLPPMSSPHSSSEAPRTT